MAGRANERRPYERHVNCASVQLAYEKTKEDSERYAKLKELGPGLLSRIRGRGKSGTQAKSALIQLKNINQFAKCCGVDVTTILANKTGLAPIETSHMERTPSPILDRNRPNQLAPEPLVRLHELFVGQACELIRLLNSISDLGDRPTASALNSRLQSIDVHTSAITFHSTYELLDAQLIAATKSLTAIYLSSLKVLLDRIYSAAAVSADCLLEWQEDMSPRRKYDDFLLDTTWVDVSATCTLVSCLLESPIFVGVKPFDSRLREDIVRERYYEIKNRSSNGAKD